MNHLWREQFLKQALFSLIDTTQTWQCGLAKPSRLLKGWNQAFLSIQIKPNSLWGCNISEWIETNEQPGRLLKWLVCLIQQSKQYPEQTNKVYQAIIEHVCTALSPKLTLTYSTRSSAFMPSLSHQAIVAYNFILIGRFQLKLLRVFESSIFHSIYAYYWACLKRPRANRRPWMFKSFPCKVFATLINKPINETSTNCKNGCGPFALIAVHIQKDSLNATELTVILSQLY